ncbi:F-actin-capping protein subunit alpha [Chytridium lagenaria]|nr:F-actin-capping protein subunit alpha [Chytridium lagenaria]
MSQLSDDEKLAIIREFILDSPPGEINDVFNDVRALLDNDSLLHAGVADTFAEYNTEHFLAVTLPASSHQVLISKYGQLEDGRFVDPRSSQSFAFDHIRQSVSDVQPFKSESEHEPFRAALDAETQKSVEDHFPNGASSVFCGDGGVLHIVVVDNKYNPNNFWNGRWRSKWTASVGSTELKGEIKVNVHYYEDGNVQLNTTKSFVGKLPTSSNDPRAFASYILKEIKKLEGDYQLSLNENYGLLAKTAFKSLRRGLPIKGTKMEWHALSNYKIGNELANK